MYEQGESRIKADKIFTLSKSIIKKRVAIIKKEKFAKVKEEISILI